MPLPDSGWIGTPQNQPTETFPLPESQLGTYQEGGTEIAQTMVSGSETHVLVGGAAVDLEVGYSDIGVDTFILTLERTEVFGELLLDSLFLVDLPDPSCFFVPFICADDPDDTSVGDVDPDEAVLVCAAADVMDCTPVVSTEVDIHRVTRPVIIEHDDECIATGTLVATGLIYGDDADYGEGYEFGADPGL